MDETFCLKMKDVLSGPQEVAQIIDLLILMAGYNIKLNFDVMNKQVFRNIFIMPHGMKYESIPSVCLIP